MKHTFMLVGGITVFQNYQIEIVMLYCYGEMNIHGTSTGNSNSMGMSNINHVVDVSNR
jgi:aspartate oxidase